MRILFTLLLALWAPLLTAHEGHDHGAAAPALPATPLAPRFEATASGLELLGRLHNGTLTLWLDAWDSNAPIAGAVIDMESGEWKATAQELEPGLYRADAGPLAQPGRHNLMLFVHAGEIDEVLLATLEVSAEETVAAPTTAWLWPGAATLLVLSALALLAGRRRLNQAAPLAALLLVLPFSDGHSHEGHDHGTPPPAPVTGDAIPSRLPDGGLFLPKPTQRLLDIRTLPTNAGTLARSVELMGHVIPDPNASGTVQAPRAGRLLTGPDGLPHLGQVVRRGQMLARLVPLAAAIDQGEKEAQLAEIKGELEVAERQLLRLQQLRDSVTEKELDAAAVAVRSLQRRRDAVAAGLYKDEALTAPIDGVISLSTARVGGVVAAGDTLFEIVQPQRLWVDAVAYDPALAGRVQEASVRLASGTVLSARLLGAGTRLRQQAVPLQFELQPPLPPLAVDEKVTVFARLADTRQGVAVPRTAVTRGPAGEWRVWLKQGAEHYAPQRVTIEPLDGLKVAITSGLDGGERVVVQGAPLLEQIR
ncbi:MAG: efflux RND transporter periplasmic adaptor subunit [Pseudomonadota bacterium]